MPKVMKDRDMNNIYAMRRANGDWFALEGDSRFCVPLFQSSHDAMMARLRNFGMLLFKPVALDARLLQEIVPEGGGRYVDFCIVNDPFATLDRGRAVEHAQLVLQMRKSDKSPTVPGNGNGLHVSAISARHQTEWWN